VSPLTSAIRPTSICRKKQHGPSRSIDANPAGAQRAYLPHWWLSGATAPAGPTLQRRASSQFWNLRDRVKACSR
jgi:hypothetical protein